MKHDVELLLKWPPSVNHYWVHRQRGTFVSAFGTAYRQEVWVEFKKKYPGFKPLTGRLQVHIVASPPDERRRDLDNILKSLLDSMKHAGVYEDDSQIDGLQVYRTVERNGAVLVTVHPMNVVLHLKPFVPQETMEGA